MKKINNIQKDILMGVLLGNNHLDSNITLESLNNGITYRVCFLHKNKNYIYHLYNIFQDFVTIPPKSFNTKNGQIIWSFKTITHPCFRFYAHQFYDKSDKKKVPRLIHRWLTPRAIAYWFMFSGSIKNLDQKYIRFEVTHFSKKEVEILSAAFERCYNISLIYAQKKSKIAHLTVIYQYIDILYSELYNIIKPYIIKGIF